MLSTASHKEKSVRALDCLTGERLEVQTCLTTQLHMGAGAHSAVWLCSLSFPNATVPFTTSSHKPLGKSTLSFDSVSRQTVPRGRPSLKVGGDPVGWWALKTVLCLGPSGRGRSNSTKMVCCFKQSVCSVEGCARESSKETLGQVLILTMVTILRVGGTYRK